MDTVIRPLDEADVPKAADLLMLATGTHKRFRLIERLTNGANDEVHHAVVAERAGTMIAAAHLTSEPAFPGTVGALVAVAAEHRGQGIGTALADELAGWAARHLPPDLLVTSTLRDDLDRGRRFAERYDLTVAAHSVGWRLDFTAPGVDLVALAVRATSAANAAGVRVRRANLHREQDHILDCMGRSMAGLPLPGGRHQQVDLTQARRTIPDDAVVLLAENHPAERALGITIITPQAGIRDWYTIFTGVVVGHRGRGMAGALKAAALLHAHRGGAAALVTHNADTNEAILRTNRRAGMQPNVGYWSLVRDTRSGKWL
ncbi:GNAT family N-acetyltransferase [Catellatospora citrea]|uniref:GNAT family N-acetyltransferase n=1 Tax=Catellatospora citrea TaxID=53366 RepID=UPI0033E456CD